MKVFELPKVQANPRAYGFSPYNQEIRPRAIGFSPDGQLLALWERGRVVVIDATQGTIHNLWDEDVHSMSTVPGIGFTADSRGVITSSEHVEGARSVDMTVAVLDVTTGNLVRGATFQFGRTCVPGPDGRTVYLCEQPTIERCRIILWDPLTGVQKPAFARHRGEIRQLAVSADEKWFATSNLTEVRVWNVGSNKLSPRSAWLFKSQRDGTIHALALSSAGAYVAASGPGVNVWEVESGEQWEVAQFAGGSCREIAFHPSLPLLAFSGNSDEVAFWDAEARVEVTRFTWDIGDVTATAFSPDGLRCAAAGTGKVVVWDVDV
jgi:WD40 repeat protein